MVVTQKFLNESAFSKCFQTAYKSNCVYIEQCDNGEMIVSSGAILIRTFRELLNSLKPFTDRSMFPELPQNPGECYTYNKTKGLSKDSNARPRKLLQDNLTGNFTKFTPTPWMLGNDARLLYAEDQFLFLSQKLLDLFPSCDKPISFYGRINKRYAPVILSIGEPNEADTFAIIAPLLQEVEGDRRFPNIPKLLIS
jgi:hypothetical protein